MVAVIKVSRSVYSVLRYNENKVKADVATCIAAENFPLNADEMTAKIKLGFFRKRMELNENTKRNTLHISLNFDPSETGLSKDTLIEIARTYMQKIGFAEQPYLVYQHHDAGHPHLHLVTTNIQADGKRIDLHHLAIRKSEPGRKEIEKIFGLVVANKRKRNEEFNISAINSKKLEYGRAATKQAIGNVLENILPRYRYTSLPELNAVLKLYNVKADRGSEKSKIYQGGGLVYRVLNEDGQPVGVPIKASAFHNKPTLKFLQQAFLQNESLRQPHKSRIKNDIDKICARKPQHLRELQAQLEKKGIHAVLYQNKAGLVYGITYIDHQMKSVFTGSALGKHYSAKAMLVRCSPEVQKTKPHHYTAQASTAHSTDIWPPASPNTSSPLDILLEPNPTADYLPLQLRTTRKKRKKRKGLSK